MLDNPHSDQFFLGGFTVGILIIQENGKSVDERSSRERVATDTDD